MRCFIAIDIDKTIVDGLRDLAEKIRRDTNLEEGKVRWVDPRQIHLTLKFLGEVADREIIAVCNAVKDAAEAHKCFDLSVGGCGRFGKPARVLWVGIAENPELLGLQSDIQGRLAEIGFKPEKRRFSGHLTLCRIKNTDAGRKLSVAAENYKEEQIGSCFVDSVCVYKSELTNKGPEYTLVSRSRLTE